jgi:uncharacterized membrane protein
MHIGGGLIGIASGAVALMALKGAPLHRRSGIVFVSSMLVMSSTAALLALKQPSPGNFVPAAVLTFYMVTTALLTVRRPHRYARCIDIVAMLAALALGIVSIAFGLLRDDGPSTSGSYPSSAYFVLGAVAVGFAVRDLQMIGGGRLHGAARLKRHLGRMCGAMIVATASFFLGQPQVFAGGLMEPMALRVVPVLLIVGAMIYWTVRMARRPLTVIPSNQ